MSIFDWLPCLPWEGPPLPRFLGVSWPWTQQQASLPKLPSLKRYVSDITEESNVIPYQAPLASYENEERTEIKWNEDGYPVEIIRHRKATRT